MHTFLLDQSGLLRHCASNSAVVRPRWICLNTTAVTNLALLLPSLHPPFSPASFSPAVKKCCSCTCSDGPDHACADSIVDCLYPDCGETASAVSEDNTCVEDWIGDGLCDEVNNIASCDYDGGDVRTFSLRGHVNVMWYRTSYARVASFMCVDGR